MFNPDYTYTVLVAGLIIMSTSIYVIYKIYKASKNTFAYVLMAFSFLDGA